MRFRSVISFVIVAILGVLPVVVFAQDDFNIGRFVNLSDADPRMIAIRLINVVLQFVGILTLIMILWGGFLFLLSGGKEEKTQHATAVIRNAIIGLVIVLCAWSIVRFVMMSLIQVSGGDVPSFLSS